MASARFGPIPGRRRNASAPARFKMTRPSSVSAGQSWDGACTLAEAAPLAVEPDASLDGGPGSAARIDADGLALVMVGGLAWAPSSLSRIDPAPIADKPRRAVAPITARITSGRQGDGAEAAAAPAPAPRTSVPLPRLSPLDGLVCIVCRSQRQLSADTSRVSGCRPCKLALDGCSCR